MEQWINCDRSIQQRLSRTELDSEQNKAKNLRSKESAIIRGVAGSGKSLVLEDYEDILFLSYNRFINGCLKAKLCELKAGLYTAMTRARDHLIMLYENENLTVDLIQSSFKKSDRLDRE